MSKNRPHLHEDDNQSGSDDDPSFFPAFFDEQNGAFPTLPGSFPTAHFPVPGSFPVWQPDEPANDECPSNPQDVEEDSRAVLQQHREIDRDKKPRSRRKKWVVASVLGLALLVVTIIIVLLIFFVIQNDDDEVDEEPPREIIPIPTSAELRRAVDVFLSGDGIESMKQTYGNIETWDVSILTDFQELFSVDRNPNAQTFNADLGQWNVSQGLLFSNMFRGAQTFNVDISGWDMSRAITIASMFENATRFRQDLCPWLNDLADTVRTTQAFGGTACPTAGTLTNLTSTPPGPLCFDCLGSVTAVPTPSPTTCSSCEGSIEPTQAPTPAPTPFMGRACFVTALELRGAVDAYLEDPSGSLTAFQYGHPISSWCVQLISDFTSLFDADRNPLAATFNEGLSGWDLSGAITLERMFSGAREFNQDLSSWDTSNVISFLGTFNNCTAFNNDISGWDTSNAGSMAFMFNNATSFNQNIGPWITSNVRFFSAMFQRASSFNG
eukprot:scaffold9027_cov174-Amphora_coffeaeformis.AAC.4